MPDAAVALISPCGYGNLGDAAIFDSVIAAVRRRLGDVGIAGYTLNPDDTAARHGIDAHPILGFSRPFYPVLERGGARHRFGVRGEGDWLARIPPLRKLRTLGAMAASELGHERACRRQLRGCRYVIVAGGGQLDEFWGGPMGQPFALWRWSQTARAVGARFLVLSVGTGKLSSRLGRRFVRRALDAAAYRSFRDEGSRAIVADDDRSPVTPDLAYAVPSPRAALSTNPGARERPLVAVSPMAYRDPRAWPERDPGAYEAHIRLLAAFSSRLLEEGLDVRFFATSSSDWAAVTDVRAAMPTAEGKHGARAEVVETTGVRPLLDFLRLCDLVLACRLHAVLLSHVVSTPVVAVSYERKVAALMRDSGQMPYCVPIETFRTEDAVLTVKLALGERVTLARAIAGRVAGFRERVEKQYDEVLGTAATSAPPAPPA